MMLMHKDTFVTKWVVSITTQMVGMCEEGFMIPIIALFYNNVSTADILKCKRESRMKSASFTQQAQRLKQLPWYSWFSCVGGYIRLMHNRISHKISIWRLQPSVEDVQRCLESPEFHVLTYLHKLTHRVSSWRSFSGKHLPFDQLPLEFRVVKGPTDPPHAEYSHLARVQDLINAFIPKEMQNTMLAILIAEKCSHDRQLEPLHREYVPRCCVEFGFLY
jgi:hypothetical protein